MKVTHQCASRRGRGGQHQETLGVEGRGWDMDSTQLNGFWNPESLETEDWRPSAWPHTEPRVSWKAHPNCSADSLLSTA